jgi:hypothetical protein
MKPGPAFDPELDFHLTIEEKARRRWWYRRTIGRLMGLVALSGLALAAYTERSRPQPPPRGRIRFVPRQVLQPVQPAQPQTPVQRAQPTLPRDRSLIPARPGIDEAMIVTARAGIDDAMIVSPGRMHGQSIVDPLQSPSPTPAEPNPGPVVPWQPGPSGPRPR